MSVDDEPSFAYINLAYSSSASTLIVRLRIAPDNFKLKAFINARVKFLRSQDISFVLPQQIKYSDLKFL